MKVHKTEKKQSFETKWKSVSVPVWKEFEVPVWKEQKTPETKIIKKQVNISPFFFAILVDAVLVYIASELWKLTQMFIIPFYRCGKNGRSQRGKRLKCPRGKKS